MCKIIVSEQGEKVVCGSIGQSNAADLRDSILVHEICGGCLIWRQVSLSAAVLYCSGCGLRVVIPSVVDSPDKLREHFKRWND